MIIMTDSNNFHDVTNIELLDKDEEGYSDIILLTTIG